MPHFPFRLTKNARRWAEYTGTLDLLLATAKAESAQLYDDMFDPDLPPDHSEQLSVCDIVFHTFELPGTDDDAYYCEPADCDGQAVLMIDLWKRYDGLNGLSLPTPDTGHG